ncbi:MAG TPA: ABC transporter ATP-binding protein [Miltoncostaeales bacterium]|jgi:osmoprotectant transport system ATP-binding protein|nr:ABC transporter ATP-binding protein [Miltoncostaeales bacterium]
MAPAPRHAASLELRDLSKRYSATGRSAVDGLTLTVPPGEICVLIGPSGCGKTTALRMINRLVEPTSGAVVIDGHDVRDTPPAQVRRNIGYVIQQVGLLPHHSIATNVATVPRLLGWERSRIERRVAEMLDLVGLPADAYAGRYPSELSGGEQQRVGLARALAAEPPLLLMDEPFSALDPITRERLQGDFLELHRAVPSTVVFVTHDIDEAVRMGDRIAIMRDGHLVQIDPPTALLERPADAFVTAFVGADRALKGLAVRLVGELPLRLGDAAVGPEVSLGMTWRDALASMLEHRSATARVTDGGRTLGHVHIDDILGVDRAAAVADA